MAKTNILELTLDNGERVVLAELPEDFYGTVTVTFEHSKKAQGDRVLGTAVIKFEHGKMVARDAGWRTAQGHRVEARWRRGAKSPGKGWTDLSTE
jgi:hypothetical protein